MTLETCESMAPWQRSWRQAIAPYLGTDGLRALRDALFTRSRLVLTGYTTHPPPLACIEDWPCEACCPLAYAALGGAHPDSETVGYVDQKFAKLCCLIENNDLRTFLNWVDSEDPEMARLALLDEVDLVLAEREGASYDAA